MIEDLVIKDFALIDSLQISFTKGLNIITGETGAGKSIIISALNILLGGRTSPSLIRQGKEEARLEATFLFENLAFKEYIANYLETHGIELGEPLIIKRIFTKNKTNKIFINNCLVSLTTLEELGNSLADFTSQHEHTSLLKPSNYIDIIDSFGALTAERKAFEIVYREFKSLSKEYEEARREFVKATEEELARTSARDELKSAGLKSGEYERLEEDLMRAEHQKEILFHAQNILDSFEEEPKSISRNLRLVRDSLLKLSSLNQKLLSYTSELEALISFSQELIHDVEVFASSVDISEDKITEMNERLLALNRLKKKYGVKTIEELINYRDELTKAGNEIEILEKRCSEQEIHVKHCSQDLFEKAQKLNKKRDAAAKKFTEEALKHLNDLGFTSRAFSITLHAELPQNNPHEISKNANATAQFLISLNTGEALAPLHKVASGGELSRILLAIKLSLQGKEDLCDTCIFDEIDTGIGGITANTVGMKLKRASEDMQCICITHLSQIAKYADSHFSVIKSTRNKKTEINIERLSTTESKRELARMLGNTNVNIKTVEELINI